MDKKKQKIMRYIFFSSLIISFISIGIFFWDDINTTQKQSTDQAITEPIIDPEFLDLNAQWVDSIYNNLTLKEKIGQLFMIAAYSNKDQDHTQEISSLINDYKVGGLIFFQGGPKRQLELTNYYQKISKTPLMISIDAEWGLAMRLDSTMKFPNQMTLGAIQNNDLIFKMGNQIALQCKRIGINVNLAPVSDINNNPNNPVINYRSFGENRENVTGKSLAYMKGLHNQKILANAKHFPGHGDTDSDSHKTLPKINHDKKRLDSVELYPFKTLIENGLQSMMVAHLYIPSLDKTPNRASSLSSNIVTNLLKKELKFKGLVFTDALNMRGVSAFYEPGKLDVQALIAGNDILLRPENIPVAVEEILAAINEGIIKEEDINNSVKKILSMKAWLGLNKYHPLAKENLDNDLHSYEAEFVNHELYKNALTIVKNKSIIPITRLDTLKIASISIGENGFNEFNNSIDRYCSFEQFNISSKPSTEEITQLLNQINGHNLIIASIHDMNQNPYQNFGLHPSIDNLLSKIAIKKKVILNLLGNPYSLSKLKSLNQLDAVLVSYEDEPLSKELSGQLIFGGIEAKGKLPVSINDKYPAGHGLKTDKIRLSYVFPESIGVNKKDLKQVENIIAEALREGVFPGCQILAAKDGQVFYQRSFGKHTYDASSKNVDNNDIYDLASITKIASSAAAIMKLYQEGNIHLDSTLKTYLPDIVNNSAYSDIILKEMLTHQARFTPWIPFHFRTLHKGQPRYDIYSIKKSDYFNKRVAENMYIYSAYRDTVFQQILQTALLKEKKYKYSDVGYYFFNEIIQRIKNTSQDQYVENEIYKRLGLKNIGYKPREKWPLERITPTEDDKTFRKQLIHGDVHDQGAALFGGVGGHAGLFSNTNDLAVLMQMYMQYGHYGGDTLYKKEVLELFTSSPYLQSHRNRRGIAFDKPVISGVGGPTCNYCSSNKSFGHSGFTGTLTWADPENGFVYVFLSNRVYPDAENRKILSLSIRTRVQKVLLDAIKNADK